MTFAMTYSTLLRREWLQHRTGWLVLAFGPMVLMVCGWLFGQVQVDGTESAASFFAISAGAYVLAVTGLAWLTVGFQVAGLARRDVQDRSIEFWRSLPVSDSAAVSATLVAHLVLMPLAVMLVSLAFSVVVAALLVSKGFGMAALGAVPMGEVGSALLAALLRMVVGLPLASFWAAALLMPIMAASAWLKRWGTPVVLGVVGAGGALLKNAYDMPFVLDTVHGLFMSFGAALVPLSAMQQPDPTLTRLPALLLQDLQARLADLAHPLSLVAVVLIAGSFALLVLRRQRAG